MEEFFDINEDSNFGMSGMETQGMIDDVNPDGTFGSVFDSGFDEDHPRPTVDQLQNAGFSHQMAERIVAGYGGDHSYSDRELFHCFYESDNPVEEYNKMMNAKVHAALDRSDAYINEIENSGLYGSSNGAEVPTSIYNEDDAHHIDAESDDEKEFGSCDCHSECKYNTGSIYKSANYGYSD